MTDSELITLTHAPRDLPHLTLGNSDALEPVDWTMAMSISFSSGTL